MLDLLRGPKTKDFPLINHLDMLTDPHNHLHIMFYKKNGEIVLLMDPGYKPNYLFCFLRVHSGGRLIQQQQKRLGAEIEVIPSENGIAIETDRLLDAIDDRTALVAVSHVSYRGSHRLDAPAIVERAHGAGALVALDVYQSAGILELDADAWDVDFMVGGTIMAYLGGMTLLIGALVFHFSRLDREAIDYQSSLLSNFAIFGVIITFLVLAMHKRVPLYETSLAFLRRAKAMGLKIAVVSSSKNCGTILKSAGLDDLFETKVDGNDLEALGLAGKPAPDGFLEAAEGLAVAPGRCVVIEDAVAGVVAASRRAHRHLLAGVLSAHRAGARGREVRHRVLRRSSGHAGHVRR